MTRAFVALALVALAGLATAQEKWTLKRTATEGTTYRYALVVDTEFAGNPLTYKATLVDEIVKVAEDGTVQIKSGHRDAKLVLDGNEMDAPSEVGSLATITYDATGVVKAVTGDMVDDGVWRMAVLETVHWPKDPVGAGDTWTVETKGDEMNGTVDSMITFKVVGSEKVGNKETVKVEYDASEKSGSMPAATKGTVWLDVATGSLVKRVTEWRNVPIAGQVLDGKVTMTLVE